MTDAQSIVTAASQLSEQERVLVVEALLDSLEAPAVGDPAAVADAWRQEVRRRSEELGRGLVKPISWTEVSAEGERILEGGN
ncbi:MAG: addiction module protein [Planctomycetota bacterium]|nr:addiction module protein [Planctomycetota bacterium]